VELQLIGYSVTNLLSNGIRFTSNSTIRKIELRFDVSMEPPVDGQCVPRVPERPPMSLRDDMPVYLFVAGTPTFLADFGERLIELVTDTGPGLTPKELDMLFQRFSQVSRESFEQVSPTGADLSLAKTHTIFGGSGLGLFVCRSTSPRGG
jgi:signal transduction histidine kinase